MLYLWLAKGTIEFMAISLLFTFAHHPIGQLNQHFVIYHFKFIEIAFHFSKGNIGI
jgi:hypothetical protein